MNQIKIYPLELEAQEFRKLRPSGVLSPLGGLGRGPLVLKCLKGTLWVTSLGDPRDYILRAGEELRLEQPGAEILVQGVGRKEAVSALLCA